MDGRHAFLAAITAAFDDDLPRLVYADWLDENGEAERADFIRFSFEFRTAANSLSDREFNNWRRRKEHRRRLDVFRQASKQ